MSAVGLGDIAKCGSLNVDSQVKINEAGGKLVCDQIEAEGASNLSLRAATGEVQISNSDLVAAQGLISATNFRAFLMPLSSAGLPAGTLWNDAGTVKIAP